MTETDNVVRLPVKEGTLTIKRASESMKGLPRQVARQIADLLGEIGASPEDRSKMLGESNEGK